VFREPNAMAGRAKMNNASQEGGGKVIERVVRDVLGVETPVMSAVVANGTGTYLPPLASILLQTLIIPASKTTEGQLIRAVAIPWFEIIRLIEKSPDVIFQIDWRKWEEIIAGAYEQAGFDEVVLTPRSNDKGRDVIAIKHGIGSIRLFDQVKAYRPGHVVSADEVRGMVGVLSLDRNVSKGVVTTTSTFAPGVEEEFKPFMPYRIELKPRDKLIPWLVDLAKLT
jgi:restriction system protein